MEYQADALTVIVYTILGGSVLALCTIIWHFYKRLTETLNSFADNIQKIKMDQALHVKDTDGYKERIVRRERYGSGNAIG